jgi:hypothetical protein
MGAAGVERFWDGVPKPARECVWRGRGGEALRRVMSTHASILIDSVGPPSVEVCRTAASFP